MNAQKLQEYWTESSDRDFESMIKNYESRQYTWALFIGHLVLEKILKALYAKVHQDNPYPPKIHNLNILAEKCELKIDDNIAKIFFACNSFNISARYEDYKNEFYKRCTEEYTSEQIRNIMEVREWLKKQLI